MKKIVLHKSNSSRTKNVHIIENPYPDSKTYAALVLLNNYYQKRDRDNLLVRREYINRIKFSRLYLKKELDKLGTLTCHYCEKTNLIIETDGMRVSHRNKATLDHVIPTSKGGQKFNVKNIVVACGRCNCAKGDMDVEEFLIRIGKKNVLTTNI